MRIDSNPIQAQPQVQPRVPTVRELRAKAERIKQELYATNRLYLETGDKTMLTLQAELSIAYERALHQVRKRLQGRTDGPFGS